MIACDEDKLGALAVIVAQALELRGQWLQVDGVVNDIAKQNGPDGRIGVDQYSQSIKRIDTPAHWDEIPGVAEGPRVPKVKVSNDQDAFGREPNSPPRVEDDAGNDFTRLMIVWTAIHSTTDGRDAPAFQMGLQP